MARNRNLRAEQIPGTNHYRGTVNYQGTIVKCDHKHLTVSSARQCGDLYRAVQRLRAERADAKAEPISKEA